MNKKSLRKIFLLMMLIALLAPTPLYAETWEMVIPSEGNSDRARKKITKKVLKKWSARLASFKYQGVKFTMKSATRVDVEFGKKLSKKNLHILLNAPGKFEIRELVDGVDVFQAFENLKFVTKNFKGVHSVCFSKRKEVDQALRALIGPDFRFGIYRMDPQIKTATPWCIVALGAQVLGNHDVKKVQNRRALKGDRSLLVKIKIDSIDHLAENGELKVKYFAVVMDGDIIAHTTLQQMKREAISIQSPSWIRTKKWTHLLHTLILHPIAVPVVQLEPK